MLWNLRPGAIGFWNGWGLTAGSDKVSAVDPGDPISHDDATTNIGASVSGTQQTFSPLNSSIPSSVAFVNSVTHKMRGGTFGVQEPGDVLYQLLRLNGTDSTGPGVNPPADNFYRTESLAMARPGGGPWTGADLLTVEFGGNVVVDGASTIKVTSFWLELDVDFAAGGFAWLIGQYLGPLVAVGLHEIPKLIRAFHARVDGRIKRSEEMAVYMSLRADRRQAFFDMGV